MYAMLAVRDGPRFHGPVGALSDVNFDRVISYRLLVNIRPDWRMFVVR